MEGTINLPLVQDRFAIRLVGYKDDIAGYIDNLTPAQAPIDYSFLVGALTGGAVTVPDGTLLTPATAAIDKAGRQLHGHLGRASVRCLAGQ